MIYKIQKSLGQAKAMLIEQVTGDGLCVECKNLDKGPISIVIYQDGRPNDLSLNGWSFPCVYNNFINQWHVDLYGNASLAMVSFDFLDPTGIRQTINEKILYGSTEVAMVEYFITLLYNISYCSSLEQYNSLYKYIVDNNDFHSNLPSVKPLDVLNFVDSFIMQLDDVKDNDYVPGLKQAINRKFRRAQELIANIEAPK